MPMVQMGKLSQTYLRSHSESMAEAETEAISYDSHSCAVDLSATSLGREWSSWAGTDLLSLLGCVISGTLV